MTVSVDAETQLNLLKETSTYSFAITEGCVGSSRICWTTDGVIIWCFKETTAFSFWWLLWSHKVTKTVKFRHCSCFTCFLLLPRKLFGQPEQSQTLITDLQVVFFIQMYLLIFHRNKIESISVLFS